LVFCIFVFWDGLFLVDFGDGAAYCRLRRGRGEMRAARATRAGAEHYLYPSYPYLITRGDPPSPPGYGRHGRGLQKDNNARRDDGIEARTGELRR